MGMSEVESEEPVENFDRFGEGELEKGGVRGGKNINQKCCSCIFPDWNIQFFMYFCTRFLTFEAAW